MPQEDDNQAHNFSRRAVIAAATLIPVTTIAAEAPELARRIDPALPYLWAEVVHAARAEHALEVADALARRVPLLRDARDQGLGAVEHAADLMARVLDWTVERRARSVADYRTAVASSRRWRD